MQKVLRGQTLILAVLVVSALSVLGIIAVGSVVTNRAVIRLAKERAVARNVAEAGLEKALYMLNKNPAYAGESNVAFGDGVYTVTVASVDASTKQIDSTGYYPNAASPRAQRTLRIQGSISTAAIAFNYGVQVGTGGFQMENNSAVNGNLYANGSVVGTNQTTIAGDVFVATGSTLDETFTNYQSDLPFGQVSPVIAAGMSFKPSSTNTATKVDVYIKKDGNPGDITLRIQSDSGGHPGGQLASGTLVASQVTTSYGWVTVPLTSNPTLVDGTTYWITLDAAGTSNSKYWIWGKDNNQGYGNGQAKSATDWDSGTWVPVVGDLNFRIWLGGSATTIQDVQTITGNAHAHSITSAVPSSVIQGSAYYDQSLTGYTVNGSSNPNQADPPIQPLPVSDGNITDWENSAVAGGTPLVGDQTLSGAVAIGPIKIAGNLTIANGAVVTIGGTVWVAGDINFTGSNAVVKLDPAHQGTSSVIIADDPANPTTKGKIVVANNTNIQGSGTSGSYLMVLSKFAGAPPQNAIDVGNNTTGAIFYATAGRVQIANNVSLKEVTAYQLFLKNGASVTYESGLANAQFTTGPGAVWTLRKNTWQELAP
jgi:Tfp pilus assembly protein PilX